MGKELIDLLRGLRTKVEKTAVYGVSVKGNALLYHLGIGKEVLDFMMDRSTGKQGFYAPGTHLLDRLPEKLLEAMPDYVLLLTWNFDEKILVQSRPRAASAEATSSSPYREFR
jgi:hypothetical protein